MSGAYTHIAAANSARERAKNVDLRDSTNFVLGLHLRYVELGALSPDYPYLSMTQHQSRWAGEKRHLPAQPENPLRGALHRWLRNPVADRLGRSGHEREPPHRQRPQVHGRLFRQAPKARHLGKWQ